MIPDLKYKPGNLLQEFIYNTKRRKYELIGLYFILDIDHFDAMVVSFYDRDGYYTPFTKTEISHNELHRKGKGFKWEIQ